MKACFPCCPCGLGIGGLVRVRFWAGTCLLVAVPRLPERSSLGRALPIAATVHLKERTSRRASFGVCDTRATSRGTAAAIADIHPELCQEFRTRQAAARRTSPPMKGVCREESFAPRKVADLESPQSSFQLDPWSPRTTSWVAPRCVVRGREGGIATSPSSAGLAARENYHILLDS